MDVYVYRTQADLVQGLISFSLFSVSSANFFKNGGAPRPLNYVMHVSPEFDWTTVTHELTHTYIEEYSGRAYRSIKWLDEGLASLEGWKCVLENPAHRQEAIDRKNWDWQKYVELKSTKGLYPLSELTDEYQWSALWAKESQYIYPEAFVVVSYLVSTYGQSRVLEILELVYDRWPASDAVKAVLGKNETEVIDAVKKAPQPAIFNMTAMTVAVSSTASIFVTTSQTSITRVVTTSQTWMTAIGQTATTPPTGQTVAAYIPRDLILIGLAIVAAAVGAVVVVHHKKRKTDSER